MEPYYRQLDLRPLSDLDDEAFAYIIQAVKGVEMLDLNETEITAESIRLLANWEYLKELRLRGCRQIDNDAIPYFREIKELELLHLKGTKVTINGLLQLGSLPRLKTLLFSDEEPELLVDRMREMEKLFPNCEFIIDGKTWERRDLI